MVDCNGEFVINEPSSPKKKTKHPFSVIKKSIKVKEAEPKSNEHDSSTSVTNWTREGYKNPSTEIWTTTTVLYSSREWSRTVKDIKRTERRKKTKKEMKIKEIQLKFFIAQSLTLLLQENYTSNGQASTTKKVVNAKKKWLKDQEPKEGKKKTVLANSNENNHQQRSLRKKSKLGVRNFESRVNVENWFKIYF
jgi:hypothetical protein